MTSTDPTSPPAGQPPLTRDEIETYVRQHQEKELLRFVAVGSVDDGKSTLIGRLLYDTQGIYDDQLASVRAASSKSGTELDLSLFTDGLKAEREQGITIDVAYRYFATSRRKFIIADTPGHVQYTRNMATGASTANVGVILIDARLGVLQQSRRHAYIASLLGIPHLAVCVNKMDLVAFDEAVFREIEQDFRAFAERLPFKGLEFFPISAKEGDQVVRRGDRAPWYSGPTLLEHLETVPIAEDRNLDSFRYPVQMVIRPNLDYRGFAAQVASGIVRVGDEVMALPSRQSTRVTAIDTFAGPVESARTPLSVTLRLADEIDVSRGDMLVPPGDVPRVTRRFQAMLVWMSERRLDTKKSYLLKHTTQYVRAEVERVHHVIDLDTLKDEPAEGLGLNDIGQVTLHCHRPLFVDPYLHNRSTGAFIVIDSLTNDTVAAGMMLAGEPEGAGAASWDEPHSQVSPAEREERVGHVGRVVLVVGSQSAAVAFGVERLLFDRGLLATTVLDADAAEESPTAEPVPRGSFPVCLRALARGGVVVVGAVRDATELSLEEGWLAVRLGAGGDAPNLAAEGASKLATAPIVDVGDDVDDAARRVLEALIAAGLA